jgi:hypothetical protein
VKGQRESFTVRQPERRADGRYSVDEDALLQFVGHGTPVPSHIVDLSREGCRLRIRERVRVRARWPVEITFKVQEIAFRFSGIVEWTDGHDLLGIHFVNMVPRRMVVLAEVICEMEAAAAARAEAVNRLVAEHGAPAPVEGQARASAERQSLEPAATEERAKASPVPAETREQTVRGSTQRDRRRQARHEVDTSATILLINVGSELRGRILDLSLSGCRIRTDERFPVGIYTRVEAEFWLQGLPFRLGGVIQAIHGRNTVGIRFLDLSDRRRQQVAELIGEIQMQAQQMPLESTTAEEHDSADCR